LADRCPQQARPKGIAFQQSRAVSAQVVLKQRENPSTSCT